MILFWAIFDGIVSYITPIVITEDGGLSKTTMGFIIGSSSVAGAIFDFLLSKYLPTTHFRRIYLLMFGLCFAHLFILWQANMIWIYLAAMATWGFYYDLVTFGNFDFVSRETPKEEHSSSFGVLNVFKALGYFLAPLIAGFVITEVVDFKPFLLAMTFLSIGLLFYFTLMRITRKRESDIPEQRVHKRVNALAEIGIWRKIGKVIFPALILIMFLNIFEAFFWTIGPLFSEDGSEGLNTFGGLLLAAHGLPALIVGWFVGDITRKFGKKKTAFFAYLFGSLIITLFAFVQNQNFLLLITFAASVLTALAWPSIYGAISDYISEDKIYDKEIEGIADFFTNLGYVVGPIAAGILADHLGNSQAFTVLGVMGSVVALILIKTSLKEVRLNV